jgi:alpha-L-fucosidase
MIQFKKNQSIHIMKNQRFSFLQTFSIFVFGIFVLFLPACTPGSGPGKYEPNWESLAQHEAAPQWFQDAKFGIYFHWGVYTVPAYGSEWYPRWMHFEGNDIYEHHLATYGHPSEFGYHDFVPMFKAENFNADEWAELFLKAGARFAGPVAEHHDGFSIWDSKATPWNAKEMGPKRDITGELSEAIKDRDMKFICTFHHAKQLQRHDSIPVDSNDAGYRLSHFPFFEGMPPSSDDEKLKYLYGNMPEAQWLEEIWLAKLKEVIDQYHPDIMWFDYVLDEIPEPIRQEYCAYYLNEAAKQDKEVVIVRKQDDLPLELSVDDLEKSRKNKIGAEPWMTDETVSKGSWCYTENLEIKESKDVLHVLIDIVSKNGVLLLNISPKADGTIPDVQKNVLLDIGEWLDKYGEAIYETRPWYTFGEGPTKEPEGHFKFHQQFLKIKYSCADIRYTSKGEDIYACFLGTPEPGKEVMLKSFATEEAGEELSVRKVYLLGSEEELTWELTEAGLSVRIPGSGLDEMAVVLKVVTNG